MTRRLLIVGLLSAGLTTAAASWTGNAAQSYCDPLGGCASLKVSPARVARGHSTKVYGSVAGGCQTPGTATVYSRAFAHASRHEFAGIPALYIHVNRHSGFAARVTISQRVKPGRYRVGGRCGGGNFGSAILRVT